MLKIKDDVDLKELENLDDENSEYKEGGGIEMGEKITIKLEEYKELLTIKGKYEELKSQEKSIILREPIINGGLNEIPVEEYKITC